MGINGLFTSNCSFCFPAGMPVASWILTLMTETCGYVAAAHWYGFPSIANGTTSPRSPTWSVSGTVKFSTWPLSFHSVLSCMLGTCTFTATGPCGETKPHCKRAVWTQPKLKPLIRANLVSAKELFLRNQVVLWLHLLVDRLVVTGRWWMNRRSGNNTWGLWYRGSGNKRYIKKRQIFELDELRNPGSDIRLSKNIKISGFFFF